MAYGELIKRFDRIRDYMREFYVYGFKSREEIDIKSARGYDNERRRMESWLGECMGFRHTAEGKNVFLSVDSRCVAVNPLHKAFHAKSFTRNDIALHFVLLDLLRADEALTVRQVVDRIASDYLAQTPGTELPDESTVRKKLREYVELGLLRVDADGYRQRYRINRDSVALDAWAEAIAFFSEADCLGVIGSFLLARMDRVPDAFRFKHHYLLRVLESEPLLCALAAIRERRNVLLHMGAGQFAQDITWYVTPVKVLASTQTGRYYLCAYSPRRKRLCCYRTDHIRKIDLLEREPDFDARRARFDPVQKHLWGAGIGGNRRVDRVEMTVFVGEGEEYIVDRLMREKRCGSVEQVDGAHWRFSADVYDPYEVGPWIRTFIGRVAEFRCSNPDVVERFRSDVRAMLAQYGGDADVVQ
ncbi:MAG TPA: WYL domain-containing protein [Clostridia bacterium]|nr:WYL domain-containing protein [Clostridia bacterium]